MLPSHRQLSFPPGQNIGILFLKRNDLPLSMVTNGVAPASGQRTIDVPAGYRLLLEPNPKLFLNPAPLDGCDLSNIEALRITFLSMETSESGFADRLLKHLKHIDNLELLCVRNSDISDDGLRQLAPVPHLKELWANASHVSGKILTRADFTALETLDLSDCTIDPSSIKMFPTLKKLTALFVRNINLTPSQFSQIANCKSLTNLNIAYNASIDDSCVADLARLDKMQFLGLGGTKISTDALLRLHLKNLKTVTVPRLASDYSPRELTSLKAKFGKALRFPTRTTAKGSGASELLEIMAPRTSLPGMR